jgi:hypothetical protein
MRWKLGSFQEPDLSYANQHYREHRAAIGSFYEPYPTMVPCGSVEKPAIFIRIPDGALKAFARTVEIGSFELKDVPTPDYALLWIRCLARDPDSNQIRTAIPGSVSITTLRDGPLDEALATVPLDLFLDVADAPTLRWLSAWSQWPDAILFFVAPKYDSKIACYVDLNMSASTAESVDVYLKRAQASLAEIPADRRNYPRSRSVLHQHFWNRIPIGKDDNDETIFDVSVVLK